ncbi:hypothetical protein A2U01_0094532, partial [Trifolium medium]|nr:hypothetical protein [Trifolium medium]
CKHASTTCLITSSHHRMHRSNKHQPTLRLPILNFGIDLMT